MIEQIAHLCIHTSDLDATERFYCKVLGLQKRFNFEKDGSPFGFYAHIGSNTFLEVFLGKKGPHGAIQHLALQTSDIDADIEHLKAHGVAVGEKKIGADGTWQVWLEDPNGVKIELHQYTPESMQIRGGTCQVNW